MAHRMINSDDQCENKAKMDVQAAPQEQMESGWSVWTLDGRCGHPSANQNVASSKLGPKKTVCQGPWNSLTDTALPNCIELPLYYSSPRMCEGFIAILVPLY